jgi:excisionase family DNA binding protein
VVLTVPEVARRLRVGADKIRAWLASGHLRGIDVAARRGGRPRWRVHLADLEAFEAARAAAPIPKVARSRRRMNGVIEYF